MKRILALIILTIACQSCDFDNQVSSLDMTQTYLIATPLKSDIVTFKEEAVAISEPVPIIESGKIYAYKNYVFVNDVYRGFHILDNTNPSAPVNIGFIKLEGNNDISIKDDRLFADSYGDLVVMDISDIQNIKFAKRMENAIYQEFWCTVGFDVEWPTADAFDYSDFDASRDALTGWEVKEVQMSTADFESKYGSTRTDVFLANDSAAESSGPTTSTTGQGGSFARFRIVSDYLYAVEPWSINVFDISDLDNPKVLEEVYAQGNIETIFNQGDILFLGGTQGMYIYDISSPDKPTYVSEFTHGRACDPVVVSGDYAFVTLRSSNFCGDGTESGLYIVDVSDLTNPTLKKTYPMTEPYGLGIKEEKLFICDGPDGLKVYDKTDINNLVQLNHFESINTYDVIPLSNSLLMIGDKVLYQYEYLDNEIRLLSAFDLN
ncbi:LVIVD repeat-containing protein [Maribacter sp. 2308TA10-17]|uniref:LVIVD repeat-containing protein n=1 Tax=Maribacter sp. 2308TA10-17 TaxID=3386276 RepID=UPI0039BD6CDF